MMRLLPALVASAILFGCGSGDASDESSVPAPSKPAQSRESSETPKPSDIVRVCADLTGQDVFSEGSPVPGFVSCLRRLEAPTDVIQSWTSD